MNLRIPGSALGMLLLALAMPAPARAQADLSSARLVTLKNGLRVLLAPDTSAAAVDVTMWSDAGTRTEPAGRGGITLLTERLLMRRPEPQRLRRELEALGGSTASFTTPDASGLSLTVPPNGLSAALTLQAARLAELTPAAGAIAEERVAIRAERPRRLESSPNGRGTRRLLAMLTPSAGYGAAVAGSDADLARIGPRDCAEYFRTRFGTAGGLLTIVGRFDPREALQIAATTVERVPRHGTVWSAAPMRAAAPGAMRVTEPSDLEVPVLFVGWRAPTAASPDAEALDLLARLLTAGASARLTNALVNAEHGGLLVLGSYEARRAAGMIYAAVTVRPDADRSKLEQALIREAERLAKEPVSPADVDRVRHQAELGLLTAWQTSWERAQALGVAQMAAGSWRLAWERLAQIRRVTPADVQRVAAATLRPERRAVLWLAPRPGAVSNGGAR